MEYFASKHYDECTKEAFSKVEDYHRYLDTMGRFSVWRNSYRTLYRGYYTKGRITTEGDQNEYRRMNVNHYHNILQHLKVMVTSQRPVGQCRAINTDYDSQAQTILGNGLLDYYLREKHLEGILGQMVEACLWSGEGWMLTEWDNTAGDQIASVDGSQIRNGDVVYSTFLPYSVTRDVTASRLEDCNWFIVTKMVNKWDLAAKYPEKSAEIKDRDLEVWDRYFKMNLGIDKRYVDTDFIQMNVLYHKKTPALPQGRMVEFLDADVCLFDGDLPYDDFPLTWMAAEQQHMVPFGYTIGYDLLPIQQAIDNIHSTIYTNQQAFGMQQVVATKGSGVSVREISEGLNLIEVNQGFEPPKGLNLCATPAELFNYVKELEGLLETLSGVNSVTRGNPEASLKSGTALALVASMSVQFNTNLQSAFAMACEDIFTKTINLLKRYATSPRIAMISGKSQKQYLKSFQGSDIAKINRVFVDVGSALSKTVQGREQIATNMLQMGLVRTPDEYFQVINTGKLEPITEGATSELMMIREENEKMLEGGFVEALFSDAHMTHINEHKSIMNSTEARQSPEVIEAYTTHQFKHLELLRTTDIDFLGLIKEPQLSPMAPNVATPPGVTTPPGQDPEAGNVKPARMPKLPGNLNDQGMAQKAYEQQLQNTGNAPGA